MPVQGQLQWKASVAAGVVAKLWGYQ